MEEEDDEEGEEDEQERKKRGDEEEMEVEEEQIFGAESEEYMPYNENKLFTQIQLNDLVGELSLPKDGRVVIIKPERKKSFSQS